MVVVAAATDNFATATTAAKRVLVTIIALIRILIIILLVMQNPIVQRARPVKVFYLSFTEFSLPQTLQALPILLSTTFMIITIVILLRYR